MGLVDARSRGELRALSTYDCDFPYVQRHERVPIVAPVFKDLCWLALLPIMSESHSSEESLVFVCLQCKHTPT